MLMQYQIQNSDSDHSNSNEKNEIHNPQLDWIEYANFYYKRVSSFCTF